MRITAHRGFSSLAPENTIIAFKEAIKYGCNWIELDTQLSSDRVLMVIHDETVNRCTNGNGKVRELSLAELRKLDAGLWYGPDFRNELIPTLEEAIILCEHNNVHLNIELKCYDEADTELLCDKVTELIQRLGTPSDLLFFSSFSYEALRAIQSRLPDIRRGHLWQKVPQDALDKLQTLDAYSANCDYRFLTQQQTQLLKEAGYKVFCYTPNFPELVEKLWDWGVDMMITDCPDQYQKQG